MSTPCSKNVRHRYGVAKVLSQTTGRPCACASAVIRLKVGNFELGVADHFQVDQARLVVDQRLKRLRLLCSQSS